MGEKEIQALSDLESKQNDGRGVSCVRSIIAYLKRGDLESARTVADIDHDKIRNYPEIEVHLWKMLWENGKKPRWYCHPYNDFWLTQTPYSDTHFVLLEGLKDENRFMCCWEANHDFTKLSDGTVAYRVLGYCETSAEAQIFLYGEVLG